MATINHVLVALDRISDAELALEKVERLTRETTATVHVARVVHEPVAEISLDAIEDSAALKTFVLQVAENELEDVVDSWRPRFRHIETVALWNARRWEGVLHAAEAADADLIVTTARKHPHFGEFIRTPDDWNLLRHSDIPVMLTKPQPWVEHPLVLVAVDVLDEAHDELNAELLREAAAISTRLDGPLHVACVYPRFERWLVDYAAAPGVETIQKEMREAVSARADDLVNSAGASVDTVHMRDGSAAVNIAEIVRSTQAELLVLGTRARRGVKGLLLGNTSERILDEVPVDVVTVHAPE